MFTTIVAADEPTPDPYAAYRVRYTGLMASALSVLQKAGKLTSRH